MVIAHRYRSNQLKVQPPGIRADAAEGKYANQPFTLTGCHDGDILRLKSVYPGKIPGGAGKR
jgi:hypothetical protein